MRGAPGERGGAADPAHAGAARAPELEPPRPAHRASRRAPGRMRPGARSVARRVVRAATELAVARAPPRGRRSTSRRSSRGSSAGSTSPARPTTAPGVNRMMDEAASDGGDRARVERQPGADGFGDAVVARFPGARPRRGSSSSPPRHRPSGGTFGARLPFGGRATRLRARRLRHEGRHVARPHASGRSLAPRAHAATGLVPVRPRRGGRQPDDARADRGRGAAQPLRARARSPPRRAAT